jgi:hypothetical protein
MGTWQQKVKGNEKKEEGRKEKIRLAQTTTQPTKRESFTHMPL